MAEISVLRHDEGIRVDGRRVVELYDELGESAAELVIGRAMEGLAGAGARGPRPGTGGAAPGVPAGWQPPGPSG